MTETPTTEPAEAGSHPDAHASEPPGSTTGGRARSAGAALVGLAAVVCLVGGMLGFWTMRTATDAERFERRVEELLLDAEISDALAQRVVTEVAAAIGIRDAIVEVLPEQLTPAADLLLAGVRSRIEDRAAELLRTPEVAAGVAAVAGRAHETTVAVIEGDDVVDGVDVSDGEVSVNLLPLTTRVLGLVQDEFGLFRDIDLPEMDRTGDPDEQRAALESAFGRDLPDDFGTPVVFASERLGEVGTEVSALRDLLVLAQRAFWLLLIAGVALAAVSIWLSSQRWRTACYLVAGMFAAALVVRVVGAEASERLPEAVESPGAQATVSQVVDALQVDLDQTLLVSATITLMLLASAAIVLLGAPWVARRRTDRATTGAQ